MGEKTISSSFFLFFFLLRIFIYLLTGQDTKSYNFLKLFKRKKYNSVSSSSSFQGTDVTGEQLPGTTVSRGPRPEPQVVSLGRGLRGGGPGGGHSTGTSDHSPSRPRGWGGAGKDRAASVHNIKGGGGRSFTKCGQGPYPEARRAG